MVETNNIYSIKKGCKDCSTKSYHGNSPGSNLDSYHKIGGESLRYDRTSGQHNSARKKYF